MINQVIIEGMVYRKPEEMSSTSGKKFYRGSVVCYRDFQSKHYDYIEFVLGSEGYKQFIDLIGDKRARVLLTGAFRTFKDSIPYVEVKYLALYPYSTNLKGGTKEVVEEEAVEEPTTSNEDAIPDDALPF